MRFAGRILLTLHAADELGLRRENLSGSLVTGGSLTDQVHWSPDRTWIAFLADKEADEVFEVFVVEAVGGTPYKVSGTMTAGGDVEGFEWSPDSTRIAFSADAEVDGVRELYVVVAQPGASRVKISGALSPGGQVFGFSWSPDGTRLGFGATTFNPLTDCSFVAEADGSASPLHANEGLPNGYNGKPEWSPDSVWIVFYDGPRIFVRDSACQTPARQVAPQGGWPIWSPPPARLAFYCNPVSPALSGIYIWEPSQPTQITRITPDAQGGKFIPIWFAWSPTGDWLAYQCDERPSSLDIYCVRDDGSEVYRVSRDSMTFSTAPSAPIFSWSPDGSRLAYYAEANLPTGPLHIVSPDGTGDQALLGGNTANKYSWFPDSLGVWVGGFENLGAPHSVHACFTNGGASVDLADPLIPGGSALDPRRVGNRVLYRAFKNDLTRRELFSSRLDGGDDRPISHSLGSGGFVHSYQIR